MGGSNRSCEGCQTNDVNVTLRQNDMVMCDLCWRQPMSSDYIYYRSIVNIEDTQDTDAVDEKIESTPQALITKEDNTLEHESDNLPAPSTGRQTL